MSIFHTCSPHLQIIPSLENKKKRSQQNIQHKGHFAQFIVISFITQNLCYIHGIISPKCILLEYNFIFITRSLNNAQYHIS